MPKVAFICVHNSCRSQIAEALGKKLASNAFESYSAGTETKPKINQDAVRLMKETVGDEVKVKAAGGIRDWKTCQAMIEAGASRIGTSSSLKILEEFEKYCG
mgnify:CR=1 FL=1